MTETGPPDDYPRHLKEAAHEVLSTTDNLVRRLCAACAIDTTEAMYEAAKEIERQQADIDKLLAERQGWLDEVERHQGVRKVVEIENDELRACNGSLRAEVERLRAVLKGVIDDIHDYERVNNLAPNPPRMECWDSVARARAALEDRP
jgi:chromosome segregation ATPase